MKDFQKDSLTIGVAGTGAMGRGIAQIAVQSGAQVVLYDAMDGAAQKAKDYIAGMLAKLGEKGKLTAEQVSGANARLSVAAAIEGLAPCDLVVEAIVENLSVKREFFQKLEAVTRE